MLIFIFLIAFIFLSKALFWNTNRRNTRIIYCIIIGLSLFLISGLRDYSVGYDTMSYVYSFNRIEAISISNLHFQKDPVYWYSVKILSLLISSSQVYIAIISAIFSFSISYFIYKYSAEPFFSFFSLLPMGYYYFSMTGFRQTIALSILLFSYKYIKERKLLKFILIVTFASLFHLSALVFILAYFVVLFQINYKYIFFCLVGFTLTYWLKEEIIQIFINYLSFNRVYEIIPSGGGGTITLLTYFLIFMTSFVLRRKISHQDNDFIMMNNLFAIGIFFQILVLVYPNMFRVSMYFSIYMIIIIPKLINSVNDKHLKFIGYSLVNFVLGIQYFFFTYRDAGIYPFKFFWG